MRRKDAPCTYDQILTYCIRLGRLQRETERESCVVCGMLHGHMGILRAIDVKGLEHACRVCASVSCSVVH